MRSVTFDFLGQHRHGTAFHQYLQLRKRFFVDLLDWDIPHNEAVEMDQYDNPCAHYALVLVGPTVVGGARVMPTTSAWGKHSYMLRDAHQGKLGIPSSAVPEDISEDAVWEITRFVVSDEVQTHEDRSYCLSLIMTAAIEILDAHGGRELISLSPVPMARTLRQLGFPAQQIGDPYRETDGRRYAMLRMATVPQSFSIAAE